MNSICLTYTASLLYFQSVKKVTSLLSTLPIGSTVCEHHHTASTSLTRVSGAFMVGTIQFGPEQMLKIFSTSAKN